MSDRISPLPKTLQRLPASLRVKAEELPMAYKDYKWLLLCSLWPHCRLLSPSWPAPATETTTLLHKRQTYYHTNFLWLEHSFTRNLCVPFTNCLWTSTTSHLIRQAFLDLLVCSITATPSFCIPLLLLFFPCTVALDILLFLSIIYCLHPLQYKHLKGWNFVSFTAVFQCQKCKMN